jgi:hypothetical protein
MELALKVSKKKMYGIDEWSRDTIRDSTLGRPTLGLGNTPTTSDLVQTGAYYWHGLPLR